MNFPCDSSPGLLEERYQVRPGAIGGGQPIATVTSKGQISIPAKIRKHLGIDKGPQLFIEERGEEIVIRPLTDEHLDRTAGILRSSSKLSDKSGQVQTQTAVELPWELTFIAAAGATVALSAEGTVDGQLRIEFTASDSSGSTQSANRSCAR